jgi:hypothetical protein
MITYESERIREINPEAVLWDGLDEAIIGISTDGKAVYDIDMMCSIIWRDNKNHITPEEAAEWVDYNILSAHVGEYTPIHIWTINNEEE